MSFARELRGRLARCFFRSEAKADHTERSPLVQLPLVRAPPPTPEAISPLPPSPASASPRLPGVLVPSALRPPRPPVVPELATSI